MNLGQLRFALRRDIGELNPRLWTNAELNDWLNEAAQVMSAECECFQRTIQAMWNPNYFYNNGQEMVLPNDFLAAIDVKWLQGSLFDQEPSNFWDDQGNALVKGTPFRYYIKQGVDELTPQGPTSPNIPPSPLPATPGVGDQPTAVFGLYPQPSQGQGPLTIFYLARHPQMTNDAQTPKIPIEFHRGLVEYAKVFAKESEGAIDEADRALKKYSDFKERLKERNSFNMITGGKGQRMKYRHMSPLGEEMGTQWIYGGDAT